MVAETQVNPTENREKVREALTSLFSGKVEFQGDPDDYGSAKLFGEGDGSLEKFRIILQRDRIRAAGRAQLFKGLEGNRIVVFLNKQVAFAGHISFCTEEGESPLGPIKLTIESNNIIGVIEWLTGGAGKPARH
ncbi:hypothetical protein J2P12_02805 [Candidatus Bathyarchaeota archaeon]|nr:hypothetical protein [Candidatus Bathyarchaeota archaeon]